MLSRYGLEVGCLDVLPRWENPIIQRRISLSAMTLDPGIVDPDERLQVGRRIRAVAARTAALLVVVDLDLRPLGASNATALAIVTSAGFDLTVAVQRCHHLARQAIHVTDNDFVLRLIPLTGGDIPIVGIQIETYRRHTSYADAAKTYRITKREMEILQLVLTGASNAQIAQALYIAPSTVADHVKSLMKKTKTTKRTALMSKFSKDSDDNRLSGGSL
jgi:DNA-binding NarL/FixJ family response regulator